MIIIHMEGGYLQGIFTDIPGDVGKSVIVAHSDTEDCDEGESITTIGGAEWHLVAYSVESEQNAGPHLFPGSHEWAVNTQIDEEELL